MSERIDEIGFGGYKLIQDTDAFCYGIDAVLLADFAACGAADNVFDLCCGNGAVSFILYAKYHPERITGLDVQKRAVELANRSAVQNGLAETISFACGDALNIKNLFPSSSFDLVVCNPPYFEKGSGISCDADEKHIARHESTAGIADFLRAGSYLLAKGGRMCIIHRPSRIPDIITEARHLGLEPKIMQLVAPHADEAPNLVLIRLIKGAGRELKVLPTVAVREKDGSYTEAIKRIYK